MTSKRAAAEGRRGGVFVMMSVARFTDRIFDIGDENQRDLPAIVGVILQVLTDDEHRDCIVVIFVGAYLITTDIADVVGDFQKATIDIEKQIGPCPSFPSINPRFELSELLIAQSIPEQHQIAAESLQRVELRNVAFLQAPKGRDQFAPLLQRITDGHYMPCQGKVAAKSEPQMLTLEMIRFAHLAGDIVSRWNAGDDRGPCAQWRQPFSKTLFALIVRAELLIEETRQQQKDEPASKKTISNNPAKVLGGYSVLALQSTAPHHRSMYVTDADDESAMVAALSRHPAPQQDTAGPSDTELLDVLASNSWDLRCISVPTGGDDAEIDWIVIEHHQAAPQERTIAQAYVDDPRAAIRRAIRETDKNAARCVSCDEVLHDGDSVYYEHGEGGHIHSWCTSDNPESFVDEDEVPLKAGDEIPKPFAYYVAKYECSETPAPQTNVLPPVVTGQMEIEEDVTAADLGANTELDDDDSCPACGGGGRVGPFFPGGLSTVCGNCSDTAPQSSVTATSSPEGDPTPQEEGLPEEQRQPGEETTSTSVPLAGVHLGQNKKFEPGIMEKGPQRGPLLTKADRGPVACFVRSTARKWNSSVRSRNLPNAVYPDLAEGTPRVPSPSPNSEVATRSAHAHCCKLHFLSEGIFLAAFRRPSSACFFRSSRAVSAVSGFVRASSLVGSCFSAIIKASVGVEKRTCQKLNGSPVTLPAAPQTISEDLTPGFAAIAAERARQITKGYDAAHDDGHTGGEIIMSSWGAITRIDIANFYGRSGDGDNYKRYLVQAAAQIVAEVERVDRAASPADGLPNYSMPSASQIRELGSAGYFREMAKHYLRALEKIAVEDVAEACQLIACTAMGSNPAPTPPMGEE